MMIFLILLFADHPFTSSCLGSGKYLTPNAGGAVTLTCTEIGKTDMLYWYKHGIGEKPKLLSTKYKFEDKGLFYDEFKDSPRFHVSKDNHLTISNLQFSDTGTYYCAFTDHYMLSFSEATSVIVQVGPVWDIQTEVHHSPQTSSAILNCSVHVGSCDEQPRVHWFRQSAEYAAGILYSHGGGDGEQCQRKSDGPTYSCIYRLPIHNVSAEQEGNYYCAVAACGYLLFGKTTTLNVSRLNTDCDCEPVESAEDREGDKEDTKDRKDRAGVVTGGGSGEDLEDSTPLYILGGALAFTSVLVVILAFVIGFLNRRNHTDAYMVTTSYKSIAETFKKGDILYYVAVEQKSRQSKKHRDDTWSECVYFNVQ